MSETVKCVLSVPDPRKGNHKKHELGGCPQCASLQVCKRPSVNRQLQRQRYWHWRWPLEADRLHICTFAHSKESPAGAGSRATMLSGMRSRWSTTVYSPRVCGKLSRSFTTGRNASMWR